MLIKPLAPLLLCLRAIAFAQSALPPTTSSPTMQQTIDFLKDMNEKQGPAQLISKRNPGAPSEMFISLKLKEPCSVVVKSYHKGSSVMQNLPSSFSGGTGLLDLARSEVNSVAITPLQDFSKPFYFVAIQQAYYESLSQDPIDDKPAIPVPPDAANLAGTVTANSGSTITFVALDGRLMNYTPPKKAKLTTHVPGANDSKATIADFAIGNLIVISGNSATNSPTSSFTKGFASVNVAITADQDAATRMAKALIHALVLCHKDDKPSLF